LKGLREQFNFFVKKMACKKKKKVAGKKMTIKTAAKTKKKK